MHRRRLGLILSTRLRNPIDFKLSREINKKECELVVLMSRLGQRNYSETKLYIGFEI